MNSAPVAGESSRTAPRLLAFHKPTQIRLLCSLVMLICLCVKGVAGDGTAMTAPKSVAPGTRKMAGILDKVIRETDPMLNSFMNEERAKMLAQQLARTTDPRQFFSLKFQYAGELVNAGRNTDALNEINAIDGFMRRNPSFNTSRDAVTLRLLKALTYLRQGELDNCVSNHTTDSCLFPIQGGGIHVNQRGSRAAIEVLSGHLNRSLGDLKAQWLLNLAYMTVGEYPAKVPKQWLIDPKYFASDYDIKRFPDIAGKLGLDVNDLAGGSVIEDFDGDGYLDIMASSWGLRQQLRLFHNNADGTFSEITETAGLIGETGGLNLVQADYNNDGFPDVLVLRGAWMEAAGRFPNSLLRNNGDGTFSDVTEEAGLLSFHPTQTAAWFDFNGDGWIDLFIGNESIPGNPNPSELYRNNGDGTFTECAVASGLDCDGFIKAVAAGDFDNDGRPDLYISYYGAPNRLYHNEGPAKPGEGPKSTWKFTEIAQKAGVAEPVHSFPAWFFDYDNDGWLDLFVAGYAIKNTADIAADYMGLPNEGEKSRLYRNNRDGTFSDVSQEAHLNKVLLAMGSNFGDLDNDGWLDIYLGTGNPDLSTLVPNRMFRNAGGKFFQDVTTSGGFGHLQKGHGISFGDLDNDGDQDIYEVMGGAYSGDNYRNVLFENPGHGNHWITLKLEGVQSNRAAIGARIKIRIVEGAVERDIYKSVSTGGSFGASPLRQEIGLGQAKAIRSVEIFWPATGKTQRLEGLEMDRFYRVKEGGDTVGWKLKTFRLTGSGQTMSHEHHH